MKSRFPVIILVHGTFAREAAWTRDDSPWVQGVREALGNETLVERFCWSGKNHQGSRILASDELARFLVESRRGHPHRPHFVVAHSHGGNVALHALNHEEAQSAINGLICLATPFLRFEARDADRLLEIGRYLLLGFVAAVLLVVTVPLMSMVLNATAGSAVLLGGSAAAILIVSGIVLQAFGGYWREKIRGDWRLRLIAMQRRRIKEQRIPTDLRIPVLVLGFTSDEAHGWLHALSRVSNAPFFGLGKIVPWLRVTTMHLGKAYLFALLASLLGIFALTVLRVSLVFVVIIVGFTTAVLFAIVLALVIPALTRATQFGFGREAMTDYLLTRLDSSQRPPSSLTSDLTVHIRSRAHSIKTERGFAAAHSEVHRDPASIAFVTEWIRSMSSRSE